MQARARLFFERSKLRILNLSQNRITELKDIARLAKLKHLSNICLGNNPFARRSWYRYTLINHMSRSLQ